jgi:hypothetical protein
MNPADALDTMLPMAAQMWMIKMAESHADGRMSMEDWSDSTAALSKQSKVKQLRRSKNMRWEDCPPDIMLFDNLIGDVKGTKGTAAILFNLLAEMIAHLSFCPGGVAFGGRRYIAAEHTMGIFKGWNETVHCKICQRKLTSKESKEKRIGPICEHKQAELDYLLSLMKTEHD